MTGFLVRMIARSLAARFRRSLITLSAVALAVAALITLHAVMVGVSDAMVRNTVALGTGHVFVRGSLSPADVAAAEAMPGVEAALPRRSAQARLSAAKSADATVTGVRPERERTRSAPAARMIEGDFLGVPGTMVLGASLAESLGARVGEDVTLSAGGRERQLRVSGIFRTRVRHLDSSAFVALDDLDGPVTELAVFLRDPDLAGDAAAKLRAMLPAGTSTTSWRDALPELVQLLALNRVSMNVVMLLATVILAMGVSNAMFISVSERTREFGILKAMGMPPLTVMALVTAEAVGLAAAGALVGVLVGSLAASIWGRVGLDLGAWTSENPHFLLSGVVYPRLDARGLALPFVAAVAFALVSALAPALRSARTRVVEAMRWI